MLCVYIRFVGFFEFILNFQYDQFRFLFFLYILEGFAEFGFWCFELDIVGFKGVLVDGGFFFIFYSDKGL